MSAENNSNIVDKNTIIRGDDFLKFGFSQFDSCIYRRNYGRFIIEIWDWYVEGADNDGDNYRIIVKPSGDGYLLFSNSFHAITNSILENLFSLLTLIEEDGKIEEGGAR